MNACGVILAGGQAKRMGGGDKSLLRLGGVLLIEHILARVRPQCDNWAINANGDERRFAFLGLPIIADSVEGHLGPLAGILAGMEWAEAQGCTELLSIPGDTPFLPTDLGRRLGHELASGAQIAVASSGGRSHPTIALWSVALAAQLRVALIEEGLRKIDSWTGRFRVADVGWHDDRCFFNINTREDLVAAESQLSIGG